MEQTGYRHFCSRYITTPDQNWLPKLDINLDMKNQSKSTSNRSIVQNAAKKHLNTWASHLNSLITSQTCQPCCASCSRCHSSGGSRSGLGSSSHRMTMLDAFRNQLNPRILRQHALATSWKNPLSQITLSQERLRVAAPHGTARVATGMMEWMQFHKTMRTTLPCHSNWLLLMLLSIELHELMFGFHRPETAQFLTSAFETLEPLLNWTPAPESPTSRDLVLQGSKAWANQSQLDQNNSANTQATSWKKNICCWVPKETQWEAARF